MQRNALFLLALFLWLLGPHALHAQITVTDTSDYVADSLRVPMHLLAKNTGDKILLR